MLAKQDTVDILSFFDYLQSLNHKTALIYDGKTFSYQWLVKSAKQLARWFFLNQYTCVMFATRNSPLTALLYLGGWLSCRDLYPVNPRLIGYELMQIIAQANPSILFVEKDQANTMLINHCLRKNIKLQIIDAPLNFIQNLPCNTKKPHLYQLDSQAITYHVSSGTGGRYNLYGHTLSQILIYSYRRQFDLGLEGRDKLLIALSLNHAYAFSYQFLPGLALGLSMALLPEFDVKHVKNAIINHRITALALLPTMYYFLCQSIKDDKKKYSHHLRFLSVAGDQMTEKLMQRVTKTLGVPLRNGIGMTEVYGYGQNTKAANKIKIFDEVKCMIRPLLQKDQAAQIGEIYLKTPTQPLGYTDKWLATGDLGYIDHQHYLHFFGRLKDIIVKGGSNISPIEIERYLYQLLDINEVVVMGRNDKTWGALICACVVTTSHETVLTKSKINQYLSNYLASYKHIDQLYFMEELPKNIMGKIDRYGLVSIIND